MVTMTSRMLIRQFSTDDVPELALMLADPEVMRYSIRGVLTKEDTLDFVDWCASLYATYGFGPWALVEKSSASLVGFCGLSPEVIDEADELHVGYRLARRFWGHGFATEAVSATLSYGFGTAQLPSVVAVIQPEHVASVRVAEKAGFRSFVATQFHDRSVRVYRKTLHDWSTENA